MMKPRLLVSGFRLAQTFGFDPRRTFQALKFTPAFITDYLSFRRHSNKTLPLIKSFYPILQDKGSQAGRVDGHYFYQDLWAASKIYERRPRRHLDIGSRIDGFVAHLLVFMEVEVVDIRSLTLEIPQLNFIQEDATELKSVPDGSVPSLSSLHAAEHFGLGRYGDTVDPEAHLQFMRTLTRILQADGWLYFSVPVGRERVEFNAQRILAPSTVLEGFAGLRLVSFSLIRDDGKLCLNCEPKDAEGQEYACGLFEFQK